MNTEIQENLKYFLTEEVKNNKRVYKIVDGTQPITEAHVFFTGEVENLGHTSQDYLKMAETMQESYCDWYAKNKNTVRAFYSEVNDFEEIKK